MRIIDSTTLTVLDDILTPTEFILLRCQLALDGGWDARISAVADIYLRPPEWQRALALIFSSRRAQAS